MKYKIILILIISFKTSLIFCQVVVKHDSVQVAQSKDATDSAAIIKDNNKAHAVLNTNTGTATPETTSGTMNSTVNPNSQVIIPFGHKKKKNTAASNVSDGSKNQ